MTATTRNLRRLGACAAGAALLASLLTVTSIGTASAEPSVQAQLATVRNATSAFHDIAAAEDAGYVMALPCFDDPQLGGMGQHWLLPSAITADPDVSTPAALVYEPRDGSYQLVAVEYVHPGDPTDTPPRLLGQNFTYLSSLGVWKLHAWIWRPNPSGMFADYNPNSAMCPTT